MGLKEMSDWKRLLLFYLKQFGELCEWSVVYAEPVFAQDLSMSAM